MDDLVLVLVWFEYSGLAERFKRVFGRVSDGERKNTIVYYNGEPYSWNAIGEEVSKRTISGFNMVEKMGRMNFI